MVHCQLACSYSAGKFSFRMLYWRVYTWNHYNAIKGRPWCTVEIPVINVTLGINDFNYCLVFSYSKSFSLWARLLSLPLPFNMWTRLDCNIACHRSASQSHWMSNPKEWETTLFVGPRRKHCTSNWCSFVSISISNFHFQFPFHFPFLLFHIPLILCWSNLTHTRNEASQLSQSL